jgi:hypothetical protein
MPRYRTTVQLKLCFDKMIEVEAANEEAAALMVNDMVRHGDIVGPKLPAVIDGWQLGEDGELLEEVYRVVELIE